MNIIVSVLLQGEKSMNIGIFGMGYWGKNILRNLLSFEEVNKITVCDTGEWFPDSASLLLDARIQCTYNLSDIIQDSTIEAVFVVTPENTHFQIALDALHNGKHVFIEKPITTNTRDLEVLIDLADKNRKILFPSHTYLHTKEIMELKRKINKDNLLGKPLIYQSNRSNYGRFRADKNVAWDLAVHDLYIIKHLFSQSPVSVSATGLKIDDSYPEVMSSININYDGGLKASIIANWLSPQKFRDTVIVGSKGSFIYDDCLNDNKLTYCDITVPASLRNVDYDSINKKSIIAIEKGEAISEQIKCFFARISHCDVKNDEAIFAIEIIQTLEGIDFSIKHNGTPYYFKS